MAIPPSSGKPTGAGDHEVAGPPAVAASAAMPWLPLLFLGAVGALLGYLAKAPCRFGGAWLDGTQFQRLCYSDVFPLYFRDGLDSGTVPYVDKAVEYPVLTGGLMYVLARAVSWLPGTMQRGFAYFDATASVMGLCLIAVVVAVGYLAGRGGIRPDEGRPFDRRVALLAGALPALAPAALLTLYINWDLFAVALATGGLVAYARHRKLLAGALIGLAVAAKFYPFLFFGPMFVLMVRDLLRARDPGERSAAIADFLRPLLGAVAAWGAVNVPVYLADPEGWAEFFTFSQERGADWGSVYYVLGQFGLFDTGDLDTVNLFGTGTLLAVCVAIGLLALLAPRRPRLEQLLLLVVAAFLITNKVWSPQFVLWLLPLAALAWPRRSGRWPALVVVGLWQLAELGYVVGIWNYIEFVNTPLGETAVGVGVETYAVLAMGRLFFLLTVCAIVVVDCLRTGDSTS
ncbi:glycosyltransferase family 87 protein [Nocardiopsis ansamitocini]|uniref:Membrane protein n=1 Tax=Nocardiopsis ansamitocini TaxID=1670832 RepID=A0A9W6P4Q0_9ACTN|nr:glycosyltransferase 87 family protein [Nocardiopsis ansamitocini]GLU47017.1 membrane protein [Nocardiopsis ansamitocini]